MNKTIIGRDIGKGFAYLADSKVKELVHSAAVVVDHAGLRHVSCSGKTATDDAAETAEGRDSLVGDGDIKEQTRQVIRNLERVLASAGATLNDVVRVRVYVKAPMDRKMFAAIHDARSEFFEREHYPASTLVVVSELARAGALIEIDADAVLAVPDADELEGVST